MLGLTRNEALERLPDSGGRQRTNALTHDAAQLLQMEGRRVGQPQLDQANPGCCDDFPRERPDVADDGKIGASNRLGQRLVVGAAKPDAGFVAKPGHLLPPDQVDDVVTEWRARLADDPRVCRDPDPVVLPVSAVTGAGTTELKLAIFRWVPVEPAPVAGEPLELAEHAVYRPGDGGWSVERTSDSSFRISGDPVERLVGRHDLENPEALAYIEERLKSMGVVKRLESQGFQPGDEVEIGEVAFALYPGVPQQ